MQEKVQFFILQNKAHDGQSFLGKRFPAIVAQSRVTPHQKTKSRKAGELEE